MVGKISVDVVLTRLIFSLPTNTDIGGSRYRLSVQRGVVNLGRCWLVCAQP